MTDGETAFPLSYAKLQKETERNMFNVHDHLKDKTVDELRQLSLQDRLPFSICALNISGDLNIGMMIRSAHLLGAERFIIMGRRRYDKRTTVGAHKYMDVMRVDAMLPNSHDIDPTKFDTCMARQGLNPYFVETGGEPIDQVNFENLGIDAHPCFIFGNEGMGIPKTLIRDYPVLSIPQLGVLRSFNVSTAMGIVAWEFFRTNRK